MYIITNTQKYPITVSFKDQLGYEDRITFKKSGDTEITPYQKMTLELDINYRFKSLIQSKLLKFKKQSVVEKNTKNVSTPEKKNTLKITKEKDDSKDRS